MYVTVLFTSAMALLPAASARIMLPAIQDAAAATSLEQSIAKVGGMSAYASPRRPSPRTLRLTNTPTAHGMAAASRATQYTRAAETSQLLGAVLRGHIASHDFARTVAAAAPDLEWLTALGSALFDLG